MTSVMTEWPSERTRICSLRYADRLLKTGTYSHLISISVPGKDQHCVYRAKNTLLLSFYDATPLRRRGGKLMTAEQMVQVLDFVGSNMTEECNCLIHCHAGRSRSPAIAIVVNFLRLLYCYDPDDHAMAASMACDLVYRDCPRSTPNGWVLKLADTLLCPTGHFGSSCSESLFWNAALKFHRGVTWHTSLANHFVVKDDRLVPTI